MEELPVKAGINTVTNYIRRLKNVISSQKSGEMAFFIGKIEQIVTQHLEKIGMKW